MMWADPLEWWCVKMPCWDPGSAQSKAAFPFPKGTEGAAHLWWIISPAPNERGQWMKDQTFPGRGGEQRLILFPGKDHSPILGKEDWNSWAPRRKRWGRCMPPLLILEEAHHHSWLMRWDGLNLMLKQWYDCLSHCSIAMERTRD